MQTYPYPWLAHLLVLAGAVLLALSLLLVQQLVADLPAGRMRARWYQLSLLIVLFIAGYAVYAVVSWTNHQRWQDLIVPVLLFCGSCFVWLTARLALHTTEDLQQLVRLEQENITDPLLGIYNRRHLDRRLEEECARALRYKMPLSVLMLDIDHFKQVNDTWGHQTGDLALQHIGRILEENVRQLDVVARYGGEELMVLAPDTSLVTAAELARRLHQHIGGHPLLITDATGTQHAVRMTVSIGVASLGCGIDTVQKLLACADRALYEAKHTGRNQVVSCDNCIGG
ncbi:MAG TPA: GGDEF domain-containing protein [Gallionellaceae bacterium]